MALAEVRDDRAAGQGQRGHHLHVVGAEAQRAACGLAREREDLVADGLEGGAPPHRLAQRGRAGAQRGLAELAKPGLEAADGGQRPLEHAEVVFDG